MLSYTNSELSSEVISGEAVVFSICIPQHSRTSFLLRALQILNEQTFRGFEVCVSDDCSDDGRESDVVDFLATSGMRHKYSRSSVNQRCDASLRGAISLASGKYVLLMGNDDCLADPTVLEKLAQLLNSKHGVGVLVTNFAEYSTGRVIKRVHSYRCTVGNKAVASLSFRDLAFVSGIVLDRRKAQEFATDQWDGSEMYQMFLGGKILSAGLVLVHFPNVAVLKDIEIPGETVDSMQGGRLYLLARWFRDQRLWLA